MEKKLRVAVLGYTGMLGHMLTTRMEGKYELILCGRTKNSELIGVNEYINFNIDNLPVFFNELEKCNIDVIVNCIGVLVAESERDIKMAIKINSLLPHDLSEFGNSRGIKLIHISTDCVFSGKSNFFYSPEDAHNAEDPYGKTKSLGEAIDKNALVLRTSIIGPDIRENSQGLFNWVCSNNNKTIVGFRNVLWSGVTTLYLADTIIHYIENFKIGLIQVSNNSSISKYSLIVLIDEIFQLSLDLVGKTEKISSKCMLCSSTHDLPVPNYESMLTDLRLFMYSQERYKSYFTYN